MKIRFPDWLQSFRLAFWDWRHERLREKRLARRGRDEILPASPEIAPPFARRPRILWVSPFPIYPMIHGSAVRQRHLIEHLARDADIYLFIFIGGTDDVELRSELAPFCREIFLQHIVREERSSSHLPLAIRSYLLPSVLDRLQALIAHHGIDLVQLEHTELGGLTQLRTPAKVALSEHDVSFRSYARRRRLGFAERFARQASAEGATWADLLRLKRYEVEACSRADQVHVMSREDAAYIAPSLDDGTRRLRIIPNGVDTEYYKPDPNIARQGLLFVGSFPHLPNLDALDYFLADIWPLVRRRIPTATLTIVGARPPQRVLDLDGRDGLTVPGEVEDLRPLYQSHQALVVPLRAGSGTRLKILEAFASGLPILSTPLGAEGIACHPGLHLLIAKSVEDWLDSIGKLLADESVRRRLSEAGRELVVGQYDWRSLSDRLARAQRELLAEYHAEVLPEPANVSTEAVEISILVPVAAPSNDERIARLLAKLDAQQVEHSFEVLLLVAPEQDRPISARAPENLRWIETPAADLGAQLNAGVQAASGRVLVMLCQSAVPQDEAWLDLLTQPLFAERSPSAVQGAVWRIFDERSTWRHVHAFTAEARRWRARWGKEPFSFANLAFRRDVWRLHPFHGGRVYAELSWQRQLITSQRLILPILAAGVLVEERSTIAQLWRQLVDEGKGWRRLQERYTFPMFLLDFLWPRPYRGRGRGLKVLLRRPRSWAEFFFPWLRPLAILKGNSKRPQSQRSKNDPR